MRPEKIIGTAEKIRSVQTAKVVLRDVLLLFKHRLSFTVVLTSIFGYLIASGLNIDWSSFLMLFLGGFLVTGAANGMNQILEKDFDALMNRTRLRPLPRGRMKMSEALLYVGLSLLVGIFILASFNPVTAVLGVIAFVIYSFVYTPLKRYHTSAVAVGAVPGALPVLIGCTAFDGYISGLAIFLFTIQFLWQFPHFWSIGYLSYKDYRIAGFRFLPEDSNGEPSTALASNSLVYSFLMLPVTATYFYFNPLSWPIGLFLVLLIVSYIVFSYRFYSKFDKDSARSLMFCSFFFMPVFLLIFILF